MILTLLRVGAVLLSLALLAVPAAATAKKPPATASAANSCDLYGPGYKPVGDTGVCLKISGYVEFGVGASFGSRHPASSSDWIKTKPAKNGN